MLRISKWIAAGMIVAAVPAFADSRFEKTLHGTVSYEGGRVTIESRFGSLTVHTSSAKQVVARAIIRSSDERLGEAFRFNVSNSSEGVVVRTEMPSMHIHGDNVSWSADVDVTIPERAPVTIRNAFGSIEVSGLRAPADIVNRQGSITARDIHGGEIETAFASIIIEGSDGDTTVRNANGSVAVSDVQGQTSISDRFAAVTVQRIGGGLSVANTNGSVTVTDVKGPTSVSDTFGPVTARNIAGPMSIADVNGNVTAVDVAGDLEVDTRFGLVKAERIRGNLRVSNSNGSVTASDINGSARVQTTYASVFLKGIDAAVDVENQNGSISVGGLRGGCNPVSLRTTYAPIKIGLASNASYTVNAHTTYGTINTEVPYTITSKNASETSSTESGVIGNGQCKMELTTTNGSITITRE
jgi:putative adhesin